MVAIEPSSPKLRSTDAPSFMSDGFIQDASSLGLGSVAAAMMSRKTEPAILTDEDNLIVASNEPWQVLCAYSEEESNGRSPKILQGDLTDCRKAAAFAGELKTKGEARTTLINYTKGGRAFCHRLHAQRIYSDSGEQYVLTCSKEVNEEHLRASIFERNLHPTSRIRREVGVACLLAGLGLACVVKFESAGAPLAGGVGPSALNGVLLGSFEWGVVGAAALAALVVAIVDDIQTSRLGGEVTRAGGLQATLLATLASLAVAAAVVDALPVLLVCLVVAAAARSPEDWSRRPPPPTKEPRASPHLDSIALVAALGIGAAVLLQEAAAPHALPPSPAEPLGPAHWPAISERAMML